MQTARVTGFEITENKNSSGKKLLLQCEISSSDDIQTVELFQAAGENSPPPENSRVVFSPIGTNGYKIAVSVDDLINPPEIEAGEKILYSSDGGTIQSKIYLDKSGNVDINDGANSVVTYQALNTALQTLVSAINVAFAAKLDGGGTSPALSVDISGSESNTVRVP